MLLTLDLSTTCTGWALSDISGPTPKVKHFGHIKPKSTDPLPARFTTICDEIETLFELHEPGMVAIEELTHMVGAQTVRALAGIRGAVEYHLWALHHMPVHMVRVSPCRLMFGVHQGATRAERKADKDIIKKRVVARCHERNIQVTNYDEADAVCLAWAFSCAQQLPQTQTKSKLKEAR